MKEVVRDTYLDALIERKHNKMIKIITGIRRVGKSYLLDPIFKNYLLDSGVDSSHIIKVDLDSIENKDLLDGLNLYNYVMDKVKDNDLYYILLDEIQKVSDFESVLNSFLRNDNLDVYVTGSNSKFLSSDVITEFRGRGDEIRVYPLSFSEFYASYGGDKRDCYREYVMYGGMPFVLSKQTPEQKSKYLISLFENTYINDILERNDIQKKEVLDLVINMLSSSIGSLTNPTKLANTFKSSGMQDVSDKTISNYINYLIDAFMINKVQRYDIKGKKFITTPSKYYFTDVGLRNARLNFREQDEDHLMENVIYNELIKRGYNVDVGIVEHFSDNKEGKTIRKQFEVDFVCNSGMKRYYIQVAYSIPNKEKMLQETKSLMNISDNFKKIIIVRDDINLWQNEDGITIMNVIDFLLDVNSLDY